MQLNLSRLTDCLAATFDVGESDVEYISTLFSKRDSIIVDVGANIGTCALPFSRLASAGTVLAFEPCADLRSALIHNLETSNVKNVRVFDTGLSNKREIASLIVNDRSNPGGGYCISGWQGNGQRVRLEMLDNVLERSREISLIKIDVEGYEAEVILGAKEMIKRHEPVIIAEVNTMQLAARNMNPEDSLISLAEMGYTFWILQRGQVVKIERLPVSNVTYNVICLKPRNNRWFRSPQYSN